MFILLLVGSSLISCDGLVETDIVDTGIELDGTEINPDTENNAQEKTIVRGDFALELMVYSCGKDFSLMVINPEETPYDYFRQGSYKVSWYSKEFRGKLAEGIWLDCVGAGTYKVVVINGKTGERASAKIRLYNKIS